MTDLNNPEVFSPPILCLAFLNSLSRFSGGLISYFRKLAEAVGIPYLECEGDGKRGPRIVSYRSNGTVCSSSPGSLLPGEIDNSPNCFLNVSQALERLEKKPIVGIYFHVPSLNLVLVTQDDKIGIRSNYLHSGVTQLVTELYSRKPPVSN